MYVFQKTIKILEEKPNPGMLIEAKKKWKINMKKVSLLEIE